MIDQRQFICESGAQIIHLTVKDAMIDRDAPCENGIMSLGMGWQIQSMSGLGQVIRAETCAGHSRADCDGRVIIEHEGREFDGTDTAIEPDSRLHAAPCRLL